MRARIGCYMQREALSPSQGRIRNVAEQVENGKLLLFPERGVMDATTPDEPVERPLCCPIGLVQP